MDDRHNPTLSTDYYYMDNPYLDAGKNHGYVSDIWEWRKFIESCYKTIKILFVTEEPGCGIYQTNDLESVFFKDKYVLDYTEDVEYFETIDQAVEFIEELIGLKIEDKTVNGIQEKLDEYVEKNEDEEDLFFSFHEFEEVDD